MAKSLGNLFFEVSADATKFTATMDKVRKDSKATTGQQVKGAQQVQAGTKGMTLGYAAAAGAAAGFAFELVKSSQMAQFAMGVASDFLEAIIVGIVVEMPHMFDEIAGMWEKDVERMSRFWQELMGHPQSSPEMEIDNIQTTMLALEANWAQVMKDPTSQPQLMRDTINRQIAELRTDWDTYLKDPNIDPYVSRTRVDAMLVSLQKDWDALIGDPEVDPYLKSEEIRRQIEELRALLETELTKGPTAEEPPAKPELVPVSLGPLPLPPVDPEHPLAAATEWPDLSDALDKLRSGWGALVGWVTTAGKGTSQEMQSYQTGGYVSQTGLALVHAGEYVTPANEVYNSKTVNVPQIVVNVMSPQGLSFGGGVALGQDMRAAITDSMRSVMNL